MQEYYGPTRAMASTFLRFLDHIQRCIKVGRTDDQLVAGTVIVNSQPCQETNIPIRAGSKQTIPEIKRR